MRAQPPLKLDLCICVRAIAIVLILNYVSLIGNWHFFRCDAVNGSTIEFDFCQAFFLGFDVVHWIFNL